MREGAALNLALEETGVVPELALDMVKVGEATGSLDDMLTSVSEFFDEEVETRMERLLSLIEPVMLVFMGLVVAILVNQRLKGTNFFRTLYFMPVILGAVIQGLIW